MQLLHVQLPPAGAAGAFIPAAAQLNPVTDGDDVFPGRGASQTVHFSTTLAGFFSIQQEHSHSSPEAAGGGFIPAPAQLNPPAAGGAAVLPGRGSSQTEHFSVALAGFFSMQPEHSHSSPEVVGCFIPAAAKSKPLTGFVEEVVVLGVELMAESEKSKAGRTEIAAALAASRDFCELGPGPAPGEDVGTLNEKEGKSLVAKASTEAFTSASVLRVRRGGDG